MSPQSRYGTRKADRLHVSESLTFERFPQVSFCFYCESIYLKVYGKMIKSNLFKIVWKISGCLSYLTNSSYKKWSNGKLRLKIAHKHI